MNESFDWNYEVKINKKGGLHFNEISQNIRREKMEIDSYVL